METEIRQFGRVAKEYFKGFSLEVNTLRYYVERKPQMKSRGVQICFDAVTHNPYFFGNENYPRRGSRIILPLHGIAKSTLTGLLSEYSLTLDIYPHLEMPFKPEGTPLESTSPVSRLLETKSKREVSFESFNDLFNAGKISSDSMFFHYCMKYGLNHVLKQGYMYISPDSSSVETLEAICAARKIRSVLEIGAGVGTCGKAAEKLGIDDFTFVDVRPEVCEFIRKHSPYPIIQANAFDFNFNRRWDLILMGMDYELNPWFLSEKGKELSEHCSIAVFQSGSPAFYSFEHDWINGKAATSDWPWQNNTQTLPQYFPATIENSFDWQLVSVALNDPRDIHPIQASLKQRGFSEIKSELLEL